MKDLNHLTISPKEWARNSALYATYEVVREEKNAVVLERKEEFRKTPNQPRQSAQTKENLQ